MRPTTKLWKDLGGRGRLPEYAEKAEPCRLSDWFATRAYIGDKPMVLFAHRETIFTAFVPMAPLEIVLVMFRRVLASELHRIEIPPVLIDAEIDGLADMSFAKTNDRSVLGSLKQLSFDLEGMAEHSLERGELNLEELQALLNRTPHVQREESFSEEAVRKSFGLEPRKRIL